MQPTRNELTPEDERILALTPTGNDGAVTVRLLRENGYQARECGSLEELSVQWDTGAGVLLIAEESLSQKSMPAFLQKLAGQAPWSDIPIIIITGGGNISKTRMAALDTFAPVGNVSFLERPFRKTTLLSVLQMALRARNRQYQMRDNLETLSKGEERLRLALNAGRIAVWEWDFARRRFACTDNLHEFAGIEKGGFGDTIEGFTQRLHPKDAPKFLEAMNAAIWSEEDFEIECRLLRPDGDVRWIYTRAQAVMGLTGDVIRIVGAAADISARVRAEEDLRKAREGLMQAQKLEAIGKLAGGIAHDFNNMLTAINGYSEMLLPRVQDNAEVEEGLREILNSGRRAAGLTQQLLAYSRQQMMTMKALDLNAAVGSMGGILQRLIREDIRIGFELEGGLPSIMADPSQVEQIILNLVLNARDAMPSGGKIRVSTAEVKLKKPDPDRYPNVEPGNYVAMEISDDGVGMDRDTKARVFDPFFTTKEQGKGTGMGLSTVYGIVKQSAGHILVESEPGKGSKFTVLLPSTARKPAAARPSKVVAPAAAAAGRSGMETLLVVEDEGSVRHFMKRLLEAKGYTVLEAADGEAALEVESAYPGRIHLLLTDVVMPGMNGRMLAEKMSQRRPGIKVLFVSGYTDDAILHHGVLDEDRAFLNKPFTSAVLLGKLRTILFRKDREPAR